MNSASRISQHLNDRQVNELLAASGFAREIGLPLTAHLTVHWSFSNAGDDPNGRLFASFRERFSKVLRRLGVVFAAVWVREKKSNCPNGAEHFHLAFHLPAESSQAKIVRAAEEILDRLAGCLDDRMVFLTLPGNGDIRYLLKGARHDVRRDLSIKRAWRGSQGSIQAKRAGFTQNLGPTARAKFRRSQTDYHANNLTGDIYV